MFCNSQKSEANAESAKLAEANVKNGWIEGGGGPRRMSMVNFAYSKRGEGVKKDWVLVYASSCGFLSPSLLLSRLSPYAFLPYPSFLMGLVQILNPDFRPKTKNPAWNFAQSGLCTVKTRIEYPLSPPKSDQKSWGYTIRTGNQRNSAFFFQTKLKKEGGYTIWGGTQFEFLRQLCRNNFRCWMVSHVPFGHNPGLNSEDPKNNPKNYFSA